MLGAFGDRVASAPTFAETLDELFGRGTARPTPTTRPSPGASPAPGGGGGGATQPLVDAAVRAFEDGQEALRTGDFAAYGQAQTRLRQALDQLARATGSSAGTGASAGAGTSGAGAASASPAPSASPAGAERLTRAAPSGPVVGWSYRRGVEQLGSSLGS